MKKTLPANINGSVFYIDEDAYNLLHTYLEQLRKSFPGQEGDEIAEDIEARISEHFTERINAGAWVIVLDDVNAVIDAMGRPSEIAGSEPEDTPGGASAADPATPPPFTQGAQQQPAAPVQKRLYRDERTKVFGGVFAGLAIYLGWNVNIMRVAYVVLALCTHLWPLLVIYMLAWMIIPPARTPRQILEMYGQPVTPNTVGRTIMGTADPTAVGTSGMSSVMSILGRIVLVALGFFGAMVGICALVVFLLGICGLVSYWVAGATWSASILDMFAFDGLTGVSLSVRGWWVLAFGMSLLIPCVALVWGGCSALFNVKGASRTMIFTALGLEIVFVVTAIVLYRFMLVG